MADLKRYVALLRAINVGGRNMKMDRLRETFLGIGFENVTTFIASGNVLFDADLVTSPDVLAVTIEQAVLSNFGFVSEAFLRNARAMTPIAARRPCEGRWGTVGYGSYVGFLKRAADPGGLERLANLATENDEFEIVDRELYWLSYVKTSESKITPAKLEKALGQPTTLRNLNTITTLTNLLLRE